ncbi:hypothetical protein ACJX0J_035363, partial [Zea mays]
SLLLALLLMDLDLSVLYRLNIAAAARDEVAMLRIELNSISCLSFQALNPAAYPTALLDIT